MNEVKVEKSMILERIKANREKHRSIFLEALEGYRKQAIAELEKTIEDAKAGRRFSRSITLVEPMDMTREYDRVIQMLEMHTEATITISNQEFRNYIQDEWNWKKTWAFSNSSYVEGDTKTLLDEMQGK